MHRQNKSKIRSNMVLGVVLFAACLLIVGSIFVVLLLLLIWYGWKNSSWKKPDCHVHFDWEEPCRVGEPVSFRISVEEGVNTPTSQTDSSLPFSETEALKFLSSISVDIRQALAYHSTSQHSKIEFVKEIDKISKEVVIKFSVRKSGLYLITVNHEGTRALGSPFRKRFRPSFIDASKTVFLRPSPTILCIAGEETEFEIQPKDKYGNDYVTTSLSHKIDDENFESKFDFIPKYADESLNDVGLTSDNVSHVFITRTSGGRVEFLMLFKEPGIYKGQILYDGKPITSGQFDILSITRKENRDMIEISNNNPAWTPHPAILLAVGEEIQVKIRKAYLYVSPKLFYVQEYVFKILPFKIATYRVSPMTKIKMILKDASQKGSPDCWDYTFSICDGIQPKITVQMGASKARIVLALYCYFLRKRLGGSENFEGKQRMFYQELRGTMSDIRMTSKQITVTRANLVYSSMAATKYFRKPDWCKNFAIKFENENGYDFGGLRREWLELLCVQFFQNNSLGMFSSIGTSRLVHPNTSSTRYPLWSLKHYEFAGKIVGKLLFECTCGDLYSQMVNARFSRSFLAQVLGLPPNYQHFEQDDPELYVNKVKYILENDVSDMELTFSEEEYDTSGKLIKTFDLIPNGSKKSVTVDNKEQYLNALALYRLGTKVAKEIEAFKKGLHDIVPEELLASFDENELELLMCGKSEFDIEDLKEHHSKDWSFGITYNKLFTWFCTAVSNMSDDERARLLQFTTGSSLLPHGGFKSLNPKFKISIANDYGKLPTAHTCFNQICLSDHDSFEHFERALRVAISEAEGFAFT